MANFSTTHKVLIGGTAILVVGVSVGKKSNALFKTK